MMASTAAGLSGLLPAHQLVGTLPSSQLEGSYAGRVTLNNPDNQFVGRGSGLTEVNAAKLGGVEASSFWQLHGNAGSSADLHFLGTTDDQPLELRVNSQRALRLQPTPEGPPNLIGGAADNAVSDFVVGSLIGGGRLNQIQSTNTFVFLGGGEENLVGTSSDYSVLVGGLANTIGTNAPFNAIGGGLGNTMIERFVAPQFCAIGAGASNSMGRASFGFIGGGFGNRIGRPFESSNRGRPQWGTVAGGMTNSLEGNIASGTIAGGSGNRIYEPDHATIGGGFANAILGFSHHACI